MKKVRQRISLILGLAIIVCLLMPAKKSYAELTNEAIQQAQQAIQQAEQDRQNLQNGLSNVQAVLNGLKDEQGDLQANIQQLDSSINEIQDAIAALDVQIENQQARIEETTQQLNEATRVADEQYEAMKLRIQFMYENGNTMYMEMIFSSSSFADFLTKSEYITSMTEYDREKLAEYISTKELIEAAKEQLEAEEAVLEEARSVQEQERASLEEAQNVKSQLLSQTNNEIRTTQQQISDYNEELDAMAQTIKDLEDKVAEEKRKLLLANGQLLTYDGGTFCWPLAKYTRVSSEFGTRMHPTLGVPLFHNGVDLASPYGTDIYAAYDGKVVAAAYTSVMGNYVMIDHGTGLYTVYMHCSKLYVNEGDIVVRGETIAAVGSTGRSTGNHLHFSVRSNGEYISPWNYIVQP